MRSACEQLKMVLQATFKGKWTSQILLGTLKSLRVSRCLHFLRARYAARPPRELKILVLSSFCAKPRRQHTLLKRCFAQPSKVALHWLYSKFTKNFKCDWTHCHPTPECWGQMLKYYLLATLWLAVNVQHLPLTAFSSLDPSGLCSCCPWRAVEARNGSNYLG